MFIIVSTKALEHLQDVKYGYVFLVHSLTGMFVRKFRIFAAHGLCDYVSLTLVHYRTLHHRPYTCIRSEPWNSLLSTTIRQEANPGTL